MKKFVQHKLAKEAKKLLAKRQPAIVAVTGSVGKSSTKQAIWAVLRDRFDARVSPKNYNTEFGVPLAILGLEMPASKFGWLGVLRHACARAMWPPKDYPKTLILEMAADKPGDITYLCDIARPDVSVITTVGESHMEFFGSVEALVREKGTLAERTNKDGVVILNRDDEKVWAMRNRTKARVMSFGFQESADVRALELSLNYSHDEEGGAGGVTFKLSYQGSTVPVRIPGVLGRQVVYAALAAACVGISRGMNLLEVSERLAAYEPPPGRMRCLTGIKRTLIIDDTYNSAPKSALAALDTLRDVPMGEGGRRFAVLGDMLELGPVSVSGHETVGHHAVECGIDYLVFVGELMGEAMRAAQEAGKSPDQLFHFSTTDQAGRFVQEKMKNGDVILVKGSRGMHMEKVVKELMADPMEADHMLVEVEKDWRY